MTTENKVFDKVEPDLQTDMPELENSTKSGQQLLALYDSTIARLYNISKISERFVGRDDELNRLSNWARAALRGQGKPVFIIGDPGIGKTELVNQFFSSKALAELKDNNQKNLLTGRYFDVGKNNSYKVFLDGFYRAISLLEKQNSSSETLLKKIKTFSDSLQELKELSSSAFLQENDREKNKYKSFELIAQNYELLCSIFPIVLFLDDLQWADELGLEFLAYLIRAMQGKPLFIICTVRERELFVENHPLRTWMRSMSRYNSYEQIKLRPFTGDETEILVNKIFSVHNFTDAMIYKLHKETGGNPYYLIEIIRQLIEDEKIRWEGEIWQAETLDEVQLPNSLVDLVELQLARLSEESLTVFQQAAVIGEDFSFQLLELITGLDEKNLTLSLAEGLKQFLIREEPPSLSSNSERYAFRYNTTRKVLYEKLLIRERKIYHSKLAKILEDGKIDVNDFDEGNIAYHYLQGGDPLKAFNWSVKAAITACSKFTFDKARDFFEWATKALDTLEKISKLPSDLELGSYYCAYGQYKVSTAEYEQAAKYLQMAQSAFQKIGDKEKEAESLISLGNCLRQTSSLGEAVETYTQALDILRKLNSSNLIWVAAYSAAQCEADLGHFDLAIRFLQESLETLLKLINKSSEREKEQLKSSASEVKALLVKLEEETRKKITREQKKLSLSEDEAKICQPNTPLEKSSHLVEVIASPLEVFKNCALEFKSLHNTGNILSKLSKSQFDPPRVVGLIFTQLKQLKVRLHSFDPITANTQLEFIEKHLNEYRIWLKKINDTLPPYTLRQYLDQGVLLQEEMLQLARFIIEIHSDANDDKIKLEILLGRALEIEVDRYYIISDLFPVGFTFIEIPETDLAFRSLQELFLEWDKVENYSQVIENNLLNKVKQAKVGVGSLFWHPKVISVIVEINLKQDFRIKELIEIEQREVGVICEQLLKAGIKSLPRQGQAGALDLEAARRMVERAKELANNNHENNRSGLMMLAEIGRLLRAYLKEQNLSEKSSIVSVSVTKEKFHQPLEDFRGQNPSNLTRPLTNTDIAKNNQKGVFASPVPKSEIFQAKAINPSEPTSSSHFVQQVGYTEPKQITQENIFLNKTFAGDNVYEVVLQTRLAEICILLATKLRDVPVKVLQLKRSQLTLASWEVEALLSDSESLSLEAKKQDASMRRAIALLAEMQEVGVSFREFSSSGKTKELEVAFSSANYFLELAKITSNDLEVQSHSERDKGEYPKAQNLAATRQKLISTHQLLSSIISWLKQSK